MVIVSDVEAAPRRTRFAAPRGVRVVMIPSARPLIDGVSEVAGEGGTVPVSAGAFGAAAWAAGASAIRAAAAPSAPGTALRRRPRIGLFAGGLTVKSSYRRPGPRP